ncbi:MAG: ABC transporter permease [Clostridium sp.]|nr:ABC transporter permease [Clostridium sp.]
MKQFFTVLKFELGNYFKNKSYLITTILFSVLLIVGLSVPSFINIPALSGKDKVESNEEKTVFAIYDKDNIIADNEYLKKAFEDVEWEKVKSRKEVEDLINEGKADAGFIVNSLTDYSYLVENSSFSDENQPIFESVLSRVYREDYLKDKNINVDEMDALYNMPIESNVEILGKDSVRNYIYTYALIFILYFMIIMYGQLIATSVTSEKSNRAIEVLVTSTSSNSLIFGKVIAGAIASFIQMGLIIGSGLVSYKINRDSWNGLLDRVFDIPSNVILTFAVFGMLGYLLYTFIFGALGALVSKTEDIGKSAGNISMIYVIVFMLTMFNLTKPDGMIIKVMSFIPFSSCNAMFVRVAMGTVPTIEIVISLVLLIASIVIVGFLGAKIYRMATLMYGNPIKLSNAIKWLKKEK